MILFAVERALALDSEDLGQGQLRQVTSLSLV
jgi:hypothetical protein